MKGQISLEFLVVFAAYLAFLFAIIIAFGYFANLRDYEEKVIAKGKGELLSVIYSLRTINNKFQLLNISSNGCAVLEDEISCNGIITKRYVPMMYTLRYGYEIV